MSSKIIPIQRNDSKESLWKREVSKDSIGIYLLFVDHSNLLLNLTNDYSK